MLDAFFDAAIGILPLAIIGGLIYVIHRWRQQRRLIGDPHALAATLLARSSQIIKDTKKAVHRQLSAVGQARPPSLENELCIFWWFTLDYCLKDHHLREAFQSHLANECGHEYHAVLERFDKYGRAVNEAKGDTNTVFMSLGGKLAEFSGMPPPIALTLSPKLFTQAGELVAQERNALKL